MLLVILAAATLLAHLALLALLVSGERRLRSLGDLPDPGVAGLPSVSVVVAARDEERGIERALRSVLAQDHPGMEVVVVDDRSADATPRILARMAEENPRLRVVRVDELPEGWLGKNHALQKGAEATSGELVLFTDADIVMHPSTVRRAAAHLATEGLDHLTLGPRVILPGWLLESFCVVFGIMFAVYSRPWAVSDPESEAHVGIGAFNLLRRSAYQAIGGHELIRLRPDDDLKLAKLIKRNRLRQGFAFATDLVSVEWYHSLAEVVRGLRKNAFAGVEYRVSAVIGATLVLLLFSIWPVIALFVTGGATWWLNLAVVALLMLQYAGAALRQHLPPWRGFMVPFATLLFIVVLWNSTLYTLRHRGIEWRGTHYPLDALRKNRV